MLIVGSGGHAKEVFDVLIEQLNENSINFFDNTEDAIDKVYGQFDVIHNELEVKNFFKNDNRFCMGVGSPNTRKIFIARMLKLEGAYTRIVASSSIISNYSIIKGDIMNQVFVGSEVFIDVGTLINTGAQIHHNVKVGEYSEISPNAILLGKCAVGNLCRIGANATILPGIKVGDNSIIAAGAVVTKNIPPNSLAIGVPAKIIKSV
jgi:sugar O-acyltransferase (sialic acid O-acetyltransferase NeuD family)